MKTEESKDRDELRKQLKEKYPNLTDEDLVYKIGKEGELLEKLQTKFKMHEHEIRKWLSLMG